MVEILANESNYTKRISRDIKYIVIHFTANDGDTARGNAKYFQRKDRNASAHYFVDENEIVRSVRDNDIAWHCGARNYKHKYCRNENSIGVEMCSRIDVMGNYYIANKTITNTVNFVRALKKKYNIPDENILRHYDVTGKLCPEPFVRSDKLWFQFLERVSLAGDDQEVRGIEIRLNGKVKEVQAINKGGFNYVKLRDLQDDKIKIGYDSKEALPYIEIVK